jgi:hypothetical protein
MSNEELIEEILVSSYKLGIDKDVFELSKKYEKNLPRVDAFQKAFYEIKKNL